ncbi:ribonucleoside-diphosphate reductase subunit alpha [Nocardiopsis oceani]
MTLDVEAVPASDRREPNNGGGARAAIDRIEHVVTEACARLTGVSANKVLTEARRGFYPGIPDHEVELALVMAARSFVEVDPNYSYVAARLLLDKLRTEALTFVSGAPENAGQTEMSDRYATYLAAYVGRGIDLGQLDPALAKFDLERLGKALHAERDEQFTFLGIQTLYDRYFLHSDEVRYELPQAFFMRVAMGLALNEDDREARAIEFYELLSSFDFMASTPTLFNSGTVRAQLSSCFLTTVGDDLQDIFHGISNNAMLSKYSGGLGNDWTPVRGLGSHIKGTNGKSQGVVPFLKIANDTAVAVNQCFAPDTPVYTADGCKSISDIRVGDLVLGHSGNYREVTDVMMYDQVDPMVQLTIKHSVEDIKVTSGHPFYAIQGVPLGQSNSRTLKWLADDKVRAEWVDAGQLSAGDYVGQVVPKEVVPVEGFGEDDARLYGILLGDGHLSKNGSQWGVSGNPELDNHLDFVRSYLEERGIHYWESGRDETYLQIHWAFGRGGVRDSESGRITGAGEATLPFTAEDIYDADHAKRISRRFSHLPHAQSRALLRGLLETDGGVSRGVEIYFTSTSRPLAMGVRYQLLRLGVPAAGQYREREQSHTGRRSDGTEIAFSGVVKSFDIRVPAVEGIAELVGCRPLTKRNWIEHQGMLFTRVRDVAEIDVEPTVFDLKVETDETYMTAAGLVHNGGKRKGAVCAYLETWHIDIEEFLDLRKNTGDERRRTHDMNTANWVPDLFMKRVEEQGTWTLFSPDEVPDLHDKYGKDFAEAYEKYEAEAEAGRIKVSKKMPAVDLWRRMLTMLFETGHPWITFKDPSNLRSPQQHSGVVHSSNLCTEITLNTDKDEVAVCNLGSVNLPQHVGQDGIDAERLRRTVRTAVRMLDNVIDVNFYTIPESYRANMRHRPVGLGLMGFQDALFKIRTPFGSEGAVNFADESMELISYYAIEASMELAGERGAYESFDGSLWSKGVLPIDSLNLLADARGGGDLVMDRGETLDWDSLRERVKSGGMRNSNVMAIAPTATIANITGVGQSIEPVYRNLFVKSNMSGDFTVVNDYLVRDLKERGLWDDDMVSELKMHDGSLGNIDRVPDDLKALYATAFEVDPTWLVDAGSRRQKWIDQAQSLNLYMGAPSGRKLDALYRHAWRSGLKTTYYLRSQSATHVEKSTLKGTDGRLNAVSATPTAAPAPAASPAPSPSPSPSPSPAPAPAAAPAEPEDEFEIVDGQACGIEDPECEACQ